MSDLYVPTSSIGGSSFGPTNELTRIQQMDTNQRLITAANPWLAQDPEALFRVASSGADPISMANNAAALAGIEGLDRLAMGLQNLTPVAQRSVYNRMTEEQQRGLQTMGYQPPEHNDGNSWAGDVMGALAPVVDAAFSPVRTVVGAPLGKALDVLTWIGDVPAHFYRAIRQMDGWQQWLALGAAGLAAGALTLASGGMAIPGLAAMAGAGTFATIGAVGGGALAAGTLATAATAITNPTEWWDLMNPFSSTGIGGGERIFSREAQIQSRNLLGNANHLDALARDIAANIDVYELATDFAGVRDSTNQNVMLESLERVTSTMADPGTPEYQRIFEGLNQLTQMEEFRQSVDILQGSKMSFGRDIAATVGLQQGDRFHGLVSGTADAVWLMALDPTMAIGRVSTLVNMTRRGFDANTSEKALEQLGKMIARDKNVEATARSVGRAIRTETFEELPKSWKANMLPIQEWKRTVEANPDATLKLDDDIGLFMQYMSDGQGLQQLLAGKGTVRGQELIRLATGSPDAGWGRFVKNLQDFRFGLADETYIDDLHEMSKTFGQEEPLERMLARNAMDEFTGSEFAAANFEDTLDRFGQAYDVGRAAGAFLNVVPGGSSVARFISNVSTQIPPGSAIALVDSLKAGDNAVQNSYVDIPRFIETMGQHFNIPAGIRRDWLNVAMRESDVNKRRQILLSFQDSIFEVTGLKNTPDGLDMYNNYVRAVKQKYAYGGMTEVGPDGVTRNIGYLPEQHSSVFLVMPDLEEMTKVVRRGHFLRNIARVVDSDLVEASMSKYIKPAWLLRIGFIPRASGEEMLAFLARMTQGGLLQEFGARSVAMGEVGRTAQLKLLNGGRRSLTVEEQQVLRYTTVSHLRPLQAIGERVGWLTPESSMLDNYSSWLRTKMEEGFVPNLNTGRYGLSDEQRRVAVAGGGSAANPVIDAILFGKNRSLRRALINGLDPALTRDARTWVGLHAEAILRATSAKNASLADPNVVTPDIQTRTEYTGEGERYEVEMLLTGERGNARIGDPRYQAGAHSQMTEVFQDGPIGAVADANLTTYLPPEIRITDNDILTIARMASSIEYHTSQKVLLEVLMQREENVYAAAEWFRELTPDLADIIEDSVTGGRLDLDKLQDNINLVLRQKGTWGSPRPDPDLPGGLTEAEAKALDPSDIVFRPIDALTTDGLNKLFDDIPAMQSITEVLDTLDLDARNWASMVLSRQVVEGEGFSEALIRGLSQQSANAPELVLFRGVPDASQMSFDAEGNLILRAERHSQWNAPGARAVSFSMSQAEALMYASMNSGTAPTGAILEISGDWLMSRFGVTMNDVRASTVLDSVTELPRGEGPYLFSHIATGNRPFSEMAVVLNEGPFGEAQLVIPKGMFRIQNEQQITELAAQQVNQIDGLPLFRTDVDGEPILDVLGRQRDAIDSFVDALDDTERAELTGYLDRMFNDAWVDTGMDQLTEMPSVIDLTPGTPMADDGIQLSEGLQDRVVDLFVEHPLLEEMDPIFARFQNSPIDAYIAKRLGVQSENFVPGERNAPWANVPFHEAYEALFAADPIRGLGQFDMSNVEQFSPFVRDFETFKARYTNDIEAALLDPANAEWLRASDRMNRMPDGREVGRPPATGQSHLYAPIVPANSTKLLDTLRGANAPTALGNDSAVAVVPRLEQSLMEGELTYALSEIDILLDGVTDPELRKSVETLRRNVDGAINGGRLDPNIIDSALNVIRRQARVKEGYWDMAGSLIARSTHPGANPAPVAHIPESERQDLVALVLEHIDRSRGKYAQGISMPIESIGLDDPRLARWLTNLFDDGTSETLPMSVARFVVPRNAVSGRGDFTVGVRREKLNSIRYAEMDNRWIDQSMSLDAANVRLVNVDGENEFIIGATMHEAVRAWAEEIAEQSLIKMRRGVRRTTRLRDDIGERAIGRQTETGVEAIEPGATQLSAEQLFELDDKGNVGRAVTPGDGTLFEDDVQLGSEELLWNVIANRVRDDYESAGGFTNQVTKDLAGSRHRVGKEYSKESMVRMTRSRIDDVGNERAVDLPNTTIVQNYKVLKRNIWDRIVQHGFDKVIGPSIDAIVRKPMSFHYYTQAMTENREKLRWLLDTQLFNNRIPAELGDMVSSVQMHLEPTAAQLRGAEIALKFETGEWTTVTTDNFASAVANLGDSNDAVIATAQGAQRNMYSRLSKEDRDALTEFVNRTQREHVISGVKSLGIGGGGENLAERAVHIYVSAIPDAEWNAGAAAVGKYIDDNELGLWHDWTNEQFELMRRSVSNMRGALDHASNSAAMRAIDNVVPFLDDHEERTMMAEYGRNFIPFWYAEENFIKRWARTLATSDFLGLDTIRKAQLTYMGLQSAGVVRTDESGNDWVVYPGSGVLTEVISKVAPGAGVLPIGVVFQASTDSLLPGVNSDFGGASPSPWLAMPISLVTSMFPDSVEMKRALLGDIGASRSAYSQFVPSTIGRAWEVFFQDETSSARYASAMNTAIAYSEAAGMGLPDSATPKEADDYLDMIRNHARIVLAAQMLAGFVSPGAPSAIASGESQTSWAALSGIGIEDPGQVTSSLYRGYVQNMGIEAGTQAFLEAFPLADLEDIVNPEAFTTSKSESPSRAPLPATATGLAWYNEHRQWIDSMPEAGAWFLPQDTASEGFDYYAYSQQLATGLRKQRSPDEFLRAVKTRAGATVYFDVRDQYEEAVQLAGNDMERKGNVDAIWSSWSNTFLAANPLFAEELQSGDSRARRERTRDQMRYAVDDPAIPPSPYTEGIREVIKSYDAFAAQLAALAPRRDAVTMEEKRQLKLRFEAWIDGWKLRHPDLQRLWSTVFQPDVQLS